MDNSVINAVKRLERAGSESSQATKKLVEAASTLADWVCALPGIPTGEPLPGGYKVIRMESNLSSAEFLVQESQRDYEEPSYWLNGVGGYLHGDFQSFVPGPTREGALQLATSVAEGWLDELAAWLERRAAEAEKAAADLEAAKLKAEAGV